MKKIVSITTILTTILLLVSCGSDNNESNDPISIQGEWITKSIRVETNYKSKDSILNSDFKEYLDKKFTIKRYFSTINLNVSRVPKAGGTTIIQRPSTYELVGDSLAVKEALSYKARISLNRYILSSERDITAIELRKILDELGLVDPNSIPDDMTGKYRIEEIR